MFSKTSSPKKNNLAWYALLRGVQGLIGVNIVGLLAKVNNFYFIVRTMRKPFLFEPSV